MAKWLNTQWLNAFPAIRSSERELFTTNGRMDEDYELRIMNYEWIAVNVVFYSSDENYGGMAKWLNTQWLNAFPAIRCGERELFTTNGIMDDGL